MNNKENKIKKDNKVFVISLIISLFIAVYAIVFNESFVKISGELFSFITDRFAWLYLFLMFAFVVFCFVISFSKFGSIKLGDDNSKPEHGNISWFSMLFCAGMGVGLVFWGISEPICHFITPTNDIEPNSVESAAFAFKTVFMHWGIHPWAGYAIVGLSLAYFQFRKKKPGLMSSVMEPLIGEKLTKGWVGKTVDILASFATIAGVVTSLGLGVLQINSGLSTVFNLPNNLLMQIFIIAVITIIFVVSSVSGIDNGVKKLSNFTLILISVFMVLCFILGPKQEIVNNCILGIGDYLNSFFKDSLSISAYNDNSWVVNWRVFYWAWWIAWAPFVGLFIARISKGRTIREFIFGVVFVPTIASVIWFSIFGSMGIHLGLNGQLSVEELQTVGGLPEQGLFMVLAKYPIAIGTSIIAIVLLISFFITSADSGTYVLAMLSSNGDMNPSNIKKVIWGVVQSLIAIGLLIAGGLKPLQTISIVAAFPFMFIMVASCVSLIKSLYKE